MMTSFRVDRAEVDTAAPLSVEVMVDRYGPPREEPLLHRSGEAPDLRPTASAVSFNGRYQTFPLPAQCVGNAPRHPIYGADKAGDDGGVKRTPSARQTPKQSTAKYQKMNKELLP
jgi:hypothetical protein